MSYINRANIKKFPLLKQDRFATRFKTCGTGSLFRGGGEVPFMPRLQRQTDRLTDSTGSVNTQVLYFQPQFL